MCCIALAKTESPKKKTKAKTGKVGSMYYCLLMIATCVYDVQATSENMYSQCSTDNLTYQYI